MSFVRDLYSLQSSKTRSERQLPWREVKNREGDTTAMAELSRRFKSTATISTKLLQAKGQWPGGARRLGTELQTRPSATNRVATWWHCRNSNPCRPSRQPLLPAFPGKKAYPHINVRSWPRNLLFPSQFNQQHRFFANTSLAFLLLHPSSITSKHQVHEH